MTTMAEAPARTTPRWLLRGALACVAVVGVVVALDGRLPDAGAVLAVAGDADPRWAAVAVLAQLFSQAMFAYQQRALLSAFGVDISPRRALAVTFSRSAISMALPAGSAVSAAYAFQQYRQRGASRGIAATVSILSGIASVVGLILLYVAYPALARPWLAIPATGVLIVVLVLVRRAMAKPPSRSRPVQTRWPELNRALAHVANTVRQARTVPARDWAATIAFAAANWLLDLVCLATVAHACQLNIGYGHLAGAYLAVQVVRQLPLTPGGIGLIETSLLAGLVAAGAAQTNAAATVLGYRLISCWLILPIGLATYLGQRHLRHDQGVPQVVGAT